MCVCVCVCVCVCRIERDSKTKLSLNLSTTLYTLKVLLTSVGKFSTDLNEPVRSSVEVLIGR